MIDGKESCKSVESPLFAVAEAIVLFRFERGDAARLTAVRHNVGEIVHLAGSRPDVVLAGIAVVKACEALDWVGRANAAFGGGFEPTAFGHTEAAFSRFKELVRAA